MSMKYCLKDEYFLLRKTGRDCTFSFVPIAGLERHFYFEDFIFLFKLQKPFLL